MFEGKLPLAPVAHDSAEDGASAGSLRGLTWSDLCSRLEAERDLRQSLHESRHESHEDHLASFDAHSARRIAALAEGKHVVNPEDLANGKGSGCIDGASHDADFGSDPRK
ncbi:hypothetical protein M3P36_02370 [Altererythrobacter sp. KTW20L]|uniref:hypothetical protein n=1 Tax=Altererythrobacter sp. KTW20L TaxID=2942210 RepID=UPI0020BDB038|nr:hypothetical protein [Altererythrobacter sp. KTW20L]MCL6249894.1 hypothetical protein [Altererythrobacter sp. KTW20L]